MKRISLIIATCILAVGCADNGRPKIALGHVDWLPSAASNINVVENSSFFARVKVYECSIPPEDLRSFAAQMNWSLSETNNVFVGMRDLLRLKPIRTIDGIAIDLVPHALFYSRRAPNGAGITVIYDLETERLYVNSSSR